ncbi:hypothetical protein IWX49DRAFT_419742 [Phyllosticta citricarpa]
MNPPLHGAVSEGAFQGTLISDLPPEMLMSVISFVDNEADLLNLSLASKQINALVQPALYSSYLNLNMYYSRSITPFLRNILKNESLARACKKVDLGSWMNTFGFWQFYLGDKMKELSPDDFDLFANAAQTSKIVQNRDNARKIRPFHTQREDDDPRDFEPNIKTDENYLRSLMTGIEEPQVILMLSCLPRIEELCLREVDDIEEPSLWSRMASNAGPGLKTLKKLTLSREPFSSTFRFHGLEPVLRLPSLREFRALSPIDIDHQWDQHNGFELQEKSISLAHIVLEDASFGERGISSLIAACKHLESLTYTVRCDRFEGHPESGVHFTLLQLKQSLLAHKDSLKHLTIDMSRWVYSHDHKTIGPLDPFTALETLAIDDGSLRWHKKGSTLLMDREPVVIADADVHEAKVSPPLLTILPRTLRELTVFCAPPVVVESLMALEDTPVDRLPFLNRIYIHQTKRKFQESPLRQVVRDLLVSVGIHFVTSHKNPRKSLKRELIENGDFFRTRWDKDKHQYISAPAKWDDTQFDEHELCPHHSGPFMLESPGSDASD